MYNNLDNFYYGELMKEASFKKDVAKGFVKGKDKGRAARAAIGKGARKVAPVVAGAGIGAGAAGAGKYYQDRKAAKESGTEMAPVSLKEYAPYLASGAGLGGVGGYAQQVARRPKPMPVAPTPMLPKQAQEELYYNYLLEKTAHRKAEIMDEMIKEANFKDSVKRGFASGKDKGQAMREAMGPAIKKALPTALSVAGTAGFTTAGNVLGQMQAEKMVRSSADENSDSVTDMLVREEAQRRAARIAADDYKSGFLGNRERKMDKKTQDFYDSALAGEVTMKDRLQRAVPSALFGGAVGYGNAKVLESVGAMPKMASDYNFNDYLEKKAYEEAVYHDYILDKIAEEVAVQEVLEEEGLVDPEVHPEEVFYEQYPSEDYLDESAPIDQYLKEDIKPHEGKTEEEMIVEAMYNPYLYY